MKTFTKFTFKEMELLIKELKRGFVTSTTNTEKQEEYFNNARVIMICKRNKK